MVNDFRMTEFKVLQERSKSGYVFYAEKIIETEEIAIEIMIKTIERQKDLMEAISKMDQIEKDHAQTLSALNAANKELRETREKLNYYNKKHTDNNHIIEKIEKNFTYEKAQMENEISILQAELIKISNADKPAKEEKKGPKQYDYEELYKQIKDKFEQSKLSYTKLQFTLGKTKEQCALLQNIVDSYSEVKSALESQISVLKDTNFDIEKKLCLYRERICMQNEELVENLNYHTEVKKLKVEKEIFQAKLNQFELDILSGSITGIDTEEFVPITDPIFQLIKNPEHFKTRNVKRDNKINTVDPNMLNLNNLKPCKPTFASLIRIPNESIQYLPPHKDWLFITIRAILDSKFHEHLLYTQDNFLPCSFPEFVYDWLGTFCVDNITRTVKQLEWWSRGNADEFRLQLLAGLSLPRSKKVWELNTFREFLLEELDLDELGFYLHCRFLLFEGPQLSHSAGKYTAMHYVSYNKAIELVKTIMEGLSSETMGQLLILIETKARKKPGYVESSFLLRTLLEYYHREKKLKYIAIQELFLRASKSDFGFNTFKDICLSLDNTLSTINIVKAYREAYMEGNGFITPEVFYVIANNLLFYHMLRLKNPWKIPKLIEISQIDILSNDYSSYMSKTDQIFQRHKKDAEIVTKFVESMGIPDFFRHISKLEGILNHKYQTMEDLKHWNLADVFKQFWLAVFRAKSVFYETNSMNQLVVKDKNLEVREIELEEAIKANEKFIEDVYLYNLHFITSKIMITKLQRKIKKKIKVVETMKNVVKTVNTIKRRHPLK
ncbi:hypothetical protein SteCoe_1117 [Stentor coeruleus]|uniref:Uncharacterized protein n=1 Tax=Stentor coeruleus TaxID=5963 RepID=A0A1R2D2P4_9CILI|nr:hypothetical protein SteCoe_1117 [Stentor coeruleus]